MILQEIRPGRQLRRPRPPLPPAASADQLEELVKAVAVQGTEEVVELRQQRGEVPAGRRQGGEGAQQDAHREHGRRRQHDGISSLAVNRPACHTCVRAHGVRVLRVCAVLACPLESIL
jgi:hypothetical protein